MKSFLLSLFPPWYFITVIETLTKTACIHLGTLYLQHRMYDVEPLPSLQNSLLPSQILTPETPNIFLSTYS